MRKITSVSPYFAKPDVACSAIFQQKVCVRKLSHCPPKPFCKRVDACTLYFVKSFFLKNKSIAATKMQITNSPSKIFIVKHKSCPVTIERQSLEFLVSYFRLTPVFTMPNIDSGMPKIEIANRVK